jgi:hypothetical protein
MCQSEWVAGKQQVIQLSENGDADLCPAGSSRSPGFRYQETIRAVLKESDLPLGFSVVRIKL